MRGGGRTDYVVVRTYLGGRTVWGIDTFVAWSWCDSKITSTSTTLVIIRELEDHIINQSANIPGRRRRNETGILPVFGKLLLNFHSNFEIGKVSLWAKRGGESALDVEKKNVYCPLVQFLLLLLTLT